MTVEEIKKLPHTFYKSIGMQYTIFCNDENYFMTTYFEGDDIKSFNPLDNITFHLTENDNLKLRVIDKAEAERLNELAESARAEYYKGFKRKQHNK